MSHRMTNGERVNRDEWGGTGHRSSGEGRHANGKHKTRRSKDKKIAAGAKLHTKRDNGGNGSDEMRSQAYLPPKLANPGNVIKEVYDAEQIRQLRCGGEIGGKTVEGSDGGDVIRCLVGGGLMGHPLAHENEAPMSLVLATHFVRWFVPPDGIVLDPFAGSGTTLHAAINCGMRGIGFDLRDSQVEIAMRRLSSITPPLFA